MVFLKDTESTPPINEVTPRRLSLKSFGSAVLSSYAISFYCSSVNKLFFILENFSWRRVMLRLKSC